MAAAPKTAATGRVSAGRFSINADSSARPAAHRAAVRQSGAGVGSLHPAAQLSLRQTWHMDVLRAKILPASLQDLQLVMNLPDFVHALGQDPPLFEAFDRLHNLRRITLTDFWSWNLGRWNDTQTQWHPALLPRSLEVCASLPPRQPIAHCYLPTVRLRQDICHAAILAGDGQYY